MPIDLTHAMPVTVAVSSTVDNAKILPEHLVDGDLETAWNSRTGDLAGAWIAIRVPKDVHVTSIRMTVGFTKGDFFTMNQRIHKVRVYRDGKLLREQELDIDQRALQDIAIDTDGGDFKIELAELVPGSKKTWREACVSELQIWGELNASSKQVASKPVVRVGALEAPAVAKPERVLLALPSTAAIALVLGDAGDAFQAAGAPIALDNRSSGSGSRDLVALQPIVASEAQRKAWIGRKLQLEGRDALACTGAVTALAVVASTARWRDTMQLDAATFARVLWNDGRRFARMLVAVVTPDGTCQGAIWAHDPAVKVVRGRLDAKRYRKVLFDDYFKSGGFDRLNEAYLLEDLNGEYGDARANEDKIPKNERLTEDLVRRTFHTYSACGARDTCVGLVAGEYTTHHVAAGVELDSGKLGAHFHACGYDVGEPLAAVDLDGDGAVELLYAVDQGAGYVGRRQTGSVSLRDQTCWDGC